MTLNLDRIHVGPIGTVCYVVSNAAGEAVLIDPGAEPDKILKRLKEKNLRPTAILLTHGHYDHIEGIGALRDVYPCPVWGSLADADLLKGHAQSLFVGRPVMPVTLDLELTDGQKLSFLGESWTVIATPGHTPGSVTFVTGNWAFTGDTLFASGGVGRTDLWGGSMAALRHSIVEKLFRLPDETVVYPGHGNHSTIGKEKAIHG